MVGPFFKKLSIYFFVFFVSVSKTIEAHSVWKWWGRQFQGVKDMDKLTLTNSDKFIPNRREREREKERAFEHHSIHAAGLNRMLTS